MLKQAVKSYASNTRGQFALHTAILAIPLMLAAGYSMDQSRAMKQKNALRSAIDAAALASVIPAHLDTTQRKAYAEEVFYQNYPYDDPVTLDIGATRQRVDIDASTKIPTMVGGMVGVDEVGLREITAAELTRSYVICVLALEKTNSDAIVFTDDSRFNSPSCSVQSNSNHIHAIRSDVLSPPIAESFCSTGGAVGTYFPYAKGNCTPVEDPYENLVVPDPAKSCDEDENILINGSNQGLRESELPTTFDGNTIIPNSVTLKPGIYCRGINISGANVTLQPGEYHVWGDLVFTQNAQVYGDRVTFILKGEDNRLLIEDGAQVYLRAPKEGVTAGLVFWGIHLNFWDYVRRRPAKKPQGVTATSEINSGGGLQIVGTAYLPHHELLITSERATGSQAPATSFIARKITIAGRANVQVNVDHARGDIPPLVPRADDGARLVR